MKKGLKSQFKLHDKEATSAIKNHNLRDNMKSVRPRDQWRTRPQTLILLLVWTDMWGVGKANCEGVIAQEFLCLGSLSGGTQLELFLLLYHSNYVIGLKAWGSASGFVGQTSFLNIKSTSSKQNYFFFSLENTGLLCLQFRKASFLFFPDAGSICDSGKERV